ncbi:unnamed protein product [Urochloa humidicola]
MPAVERAQRNLWRKLGVSDEEFKPIDKILQEFIAMFTSPLPPNIMVALTSLFDLDDDNDDDQISDAMIELTREAVNDLRQEAGNMSA